MEAGPASPPIIKTTLTDITALTRAQERLALLSGASKLLEASLDWQSAVAPTLKLLLARQTPVCVLDVLDGDGRLSRVELVHRPDLPAFAATALKGLPAPRSPDELERFVLGSGRSFLRRPGERLSDPPRSDRTASLLRLAGAKGFLMTPLLVRSKPAGLLTLLLLSQEFFAAEDQQMIEELASRLALALERSRLHQQVRRMLDVRDELMACVSHDLKNPLAGMLFTTESLLRASSSGELRPTFAHIDRIRRAAYHMRSLVEDLSYFSSIESGRLSLAPRTERVGQLLGACADLFLPVSQQTNVALVIEPHDEAILVRCDRERVLQVFSNLLGNAFKFTPAGGQITVAVEVACDEIVFSIRDSGPGIAADRVEQVFERYWQAEETARKGRGLGLYIAKRIVEAQGGKIWAASPPGQGAVFSFTLPRPGAEG
jgi:signal transduction histidine kinase